MTTILTVAAAAEIMGFSPRKVRDLAQADADFRERCVRHPKWVAGMRINGEALAEWMDEQMRGTGENPSPSPDDAIQMRRRA
jgi:hypothetical protein